MRNQRGSTIIELLLYIGLTSILLAIMSQVFLATLGVGVESRQTSDVQQDGRYLLQRMGYDIRRASTIVVPAVGSSAAELTLVISEGGIDNTYRYSISGADLMLSVGTESASLHSSRTQIGAFTVRRVGNSASVQDAKDTILIDLTVVEPSQVSGGQSLDLHTAFGLR